MFKKLLICFVALLMLLCGKSQVYANDTVYTLTHQGILQEGHLDVQSYDLDDELESFLLSQLKNKVPQIDLSAYHLSVLDIDAVVQELLNNNPQLYNISFDHCDTVNNQVTTLYVQYQISRLRTASDPYESVVQDILSGINDNMTDLEKIVYIHEWLVLNVEYDYDNYVSGTIPAQSYTAYGALVNRKAVCQGYTLAYQDLLNRLGIENINVSSQRLNHVWNQVKLDGYWYYIDATWDDPVPDAKGQVMHNNLLVSKDKLISTGHTYGDWTKHYDTNSARFDNYFWLSVKQPIDIIDGYTYCALNSYESSNLIGSVTISKIDINNQKMEKVWSFKDRWFLLDQSGFFWQGAYSGCVYDDGRIYYNNSKEIRSVAIDGTDDQLYLKVDTTTNYLTNVIKLDNVMYYVLSDIGSSTGNPAQFVKIKDIAISIVSIEIAKPRELTVGESLYLDVTVYPSNSTNKNLYYSSYDETVAKVDQNGKVTATGAGTTTITVQADNGVKATCQITVVAVDGLLGDVNNSGKVDYNDAILILQSDSGLIQLTDDQKAVSDTNHDGIIDYNDAIQILKYDANIITEF